jgi:lysophospholipase L1-like esterase
MKTIVCLGDSITDNRIDPTYVTYWQQLCNERYGEHAIRIINAGVCGETAFDGLQRIDQDVKPYQPDLVTVCFGHNEVYQGVSTDHFARSMQAIVERVKMDSCSVWIMTPNQIVDQEISKSYQEYLTALHELASVAHCPLIDLWRVFAGHNLNSIFTYSFEGGGGNDYLHPNEHGHRLIAQQLMMKLDEFMSHNM